MSQAKQPRKERSERASDGEQSETNFQPNMKLVQHLIVFAAVLIVGATASETSLSAEVKEKTKLRNSGAAKEGAKVRRTGLSSPTPACLLHSQPDLPCNVCAPLVGMILKSTIEST